MSRTDTSMGTLAKGWVEETHGQVARELGILQEAMLERVDQLASELASASHEELAEVEGVQVYAESFLVDAGRLLELLASRLDAGLAERVEPMLERAESSGEAGVEARLSVARWCRDARQYLTFVAQYVAGYVQGGGVALGLLLEMPEGPIDRAVITSIVRHRLMFAADRAELAATRWAEEVGAELVQVARRLDGGPEVTPEVTPKVTPEVTPEPVSEPHAESEADRLTRLLARADELGVKVKKVPSSPSHGWLDKMEAQLDTVAEKRKAQAESSHARKARLAEMLAFAAELKVTLKKVPSNPSEAWLDKMEAKLVEVAGKRKVAVPASFADVTSEEEAVDTSDSAPEREVVPSRMSPAERRSRVEAMVAKAQKAELDLGNVPEEPTDQWVEGTEERLEKALAARKAERKAVREKKKRERDARIARLTEDSKRLGLDLGPVPKFPTEDWLSRMEMKIASMRMPSEDDSGNDDRGARLAEIMRLAEEHRIELGEVPPDPDNLWLTWAEGRVNDVAASEELIAAGEDPEEPPLERPRVVFEEGTVQERVWMMEDGELTVGRARGNHVQVRDDRGVSRLHCTIFERDGVYYLRDNGSTKGTLLNGHLVVDDQAIDSGDHIAVGDTEMVFRV